MSSLSIRSFTLFREEQPVRDALVLFTLTLLLHFLGAMLRLVQELSFFWPLNAVMAGIFARYVWLNRSYFYAVCFAAMLVYDGLTSRWGMGFASLLINFSNIVFIVTLAQLVENNALFYGPDSLRHFPEYTGKSVCRDGLLPRRPDFRPLPQRGSAAGRPGDFVL